MPGGVADPLLQDCGTGVAPMIAGQPLRNVPDAPFGPGKLERASRPSKTVSPADEARPAVHAPEVDGAQQDASSPVDDEAQALAVVEEREPVPSLILAGAALAQAQDRAVPEQVRHG